MVDDVTVRQKPAKIQQAERVCLSACQEETQIGGNSISRGRVD